MAIISVTNDRPVGAFVKPHGNDFPCTGIGLAAKQIAGRHGGRVWTLGGAGEGTTYPGALRQGGGDHV